MPGVDVTMQMAAPVGRVGQRLGDPVAMSGLTAEHVEIVEMRWVGVATGQGVGARFRGRDRSGWRRWTTSCTLVDPGRRIAETTLSRVKGRAEA